VFFLYDVINIWLFGWRVARLYIDGNAVSKPPADNFQKFSLNSGYIHDGKRRLLAAFPCWILFQLWIFAVQNKFQQQRWNGIHSVPNADATRSFYFRRRNAADFIFKTTTAVHS
jgi:hypothetical protein